MGAVHAQTILVLLVFFLTDPNVCFVFVTLPGPTDQPPACSVIPPQQEPGAQAPAPDPHHDACQRSAPTHSIPSPGTGSWGSFGFAQTWINAWVECSSV